MDVILKLTGEGGGHAVLGEQDADGDLGSIGNAGTGRR